MIPISRTAAPARLSANWGAARCSQPPVDIGHRFIEHRYTRKDASGETAMNIQSAMRDVDFRSSLAADSASAAKYFETADTALRSLGPPSSRSKNAKKDAQDIKARSRAAKEAFLRRHITEIYDTVTDHRAKT